MEENWVEIWRGRGSAANWLHHELLREGVRHRVNHLLRNVTDAGNTEEMSLEVSEAEKERAQRTIEKLLARESARPD